MAVKKIIGDPEIDAIIAQVEKQFAKPGMITLGPSKAKIVPIPTGSLALDIGLGIGGWPRGRIVEIYGPESSGKTSLAILAAALYEKNKASWGHENRYVLIVDVEHTITIDLLEGIGLDPNKVIFARPDTGAEALQSLMDLVKTGRIGFAILDSIDAIQTDAQLKKKMNENEMGGSSKMLNRFMREFSKLCGNTETTVIFLNQMKYKPGAMGNPETTPGGTGLKFYSSVRLKTLAGKPSKRLPGAFTMRLKTVKNKVAPPRADEIVFEFLYAEGPDPYFDVITTAKELGLARFGGATFYMLWPGDTEDTKLSKGGFVGTREFLINNPEIYERLRTVCLTTADSTTGIEIEDDPTEPSNELDEAASS